MIGNVLDIHTVPAKIEVHSTSASLSEHYVPSKLEIDKTPAHIDMQSKNITVNVDSSACQAEEGHKTISQLTEEYAKAGMESIQQFAHNASVVRSQLLDAKRGEDVYKEISKQSLQFEIPETGLKFIPSEPPKISWNMNELKIEGHREKDTFNWKTTTWPDIRQQSYGGVTVDEVQKPEVQITYTGNALDARA